LDIRDNRGDAENLDIAIQWTSIKAVAADPRSIEDPQPSNSPQPPPGVERMEQLAGSNERDGLVPCVYLKARLEDLREAKVNPASHDMAESIELEAHQMRSSISAVADIANQRQPVGIGSVVVLEQTDEAIENKRLADDSSVVLFPYTADRHTVLGEVQLSTSA
jgi:hypothetical protein